MPSEWAESTMVEPDEYRRRRRRKGPKVRSYVRPTKVHMQKHRRKKPKYPLKEFFDDWADD